MKLKYWDVPENGGRKLIRWEKDVNSRGIEKVWRDFDNKLLDKEDSQRVKCGFPEIRFAKVVLENQNKRKVKGQAQLVEEW
jgi:hypothetical protein